MLRFIAAALVSGYATTAAAQAVLVPHPPAYTDGESFVGYVIMQDSARIPFNQYVKYRNGSRFLLQAAGIARAGSSLFSGISNIDTLTGFVQAGDDLLKVLSSDCKSDWLYPLILNKEYRCTMRVNLNGRPDELQRTVFVVSAHYREGRLASYCTLDTASYSDREVKSRVCYTPDGKWVREMWPIGVTSQSRI